MRTLLLFTAVLALAGCEDSKPYVKGADPCKPPVLLPSDWANGQQVELLWAQDRRELLDCADKVETLSGRKVETPT